MLLQVPVHRQVIHEADAGEIRQERLVLRAEQLAGAVAGGRAGRERPQDLKVGDAGPDGRARGALGLGETESRLGRHGRGRDGPGRRRDVGRRIVTRAERQDRAIGGAAGREAAETAPVGDLGLAGEAHLIDAVELAAAGPDRQGRVRQGPAECIGRDRCLRVGILREGPGLLHQIGEHIAGLTRQRDRAVDADRRRRLYHLERHARARPAELQPAALLMLPIMHADVVGGACGQRHCLGRGLGRVAVVGIERGPGGGSGRAEIERHAAIGDDLQRIGLGRGRHDLAGPAAGETLPGRRVEFRRQRAAGTDRVPGEIDAGVAPLKGRRRHAGQSRLILADETAPEHALCQRGAERRRQGKCRHRKGDHARERAKFAVHAASAHQRYMWPADLKF